MRSLRLAAAVWVTTSATSLATGCSDDDGVLPGQVDAAQPGGDGGTNADGSVAGCTCLALGVDYTSGTGTLARLDLPTLTVTRDVVPGGISSDPVLRVEEGRVVVVNRFGADNVTILDPVTLQVVSQFSTGSGSNPQDAASRGDVVFVPVFGEASIKAVRLREPEPVEPLPGVDLASYDADGNPNAASIALMGARGYVSLGILDDADPYFAPKGRGRILAFDLEDGQVSASFELTWSNPLGFLHRAGDDLLVATAPTFGADEGCVERITTGPVPASAGCLVDNTALGGYPTAIAPAAGGAIFLAVAPAFMEGKLIRISSTGAVEGEPISGPDEVVTDAAYCAAADLLVYNDQMTGGLHVHDVGAGARLTEGPLDIGLPSAFSNGLACF